MQVQATLPAESRGFVGSAVRLVLLVALGGLVLAVIMGGKTDPMTNLKIFATRFLGVFIEASPFLLLGTLASGLIEAFVSREDIVRWMPRNRFLATFAGAFMGFAFPVCECGVVPVVRRLFNKGLPMSVGITFLLAAPVMNPIVWVSTYIAFGQIAPAVFFGRIIFTLIVALTVGMLFALAARPQDVLRPGALLPVMGGSGEAALVSAAPQRKSIGAGLMSALRVANEEFFEMGRYLILGSLVAASLQTLQANLTFTMNGSTHTAQDFLLTLGASPVLSVIALQVLAFILSVCSTVDAFLALAFYNTFTLGSILSFLTFGPMVDIKSTLMFLGVFKRRTVAYLIILPLLLAMLGGIWINLYLRY